MYSILYGIYILISRPHYDEKLRVWHPYASITRDDEFHYHQLNNLDKNFETEKEAIAFGLGAARNWVEEYQQQFANLKAKR